MVAFLFGGKGSVEFLGLEESAAEGVEGFGGEVRVLGGGLEILKRCVRRRFLLKMCDASSSLRTS